MVMDKNTEITLLLNSKAPADKQKCIPLLQQYLGENPSDAEAYYDLAGCFDTLGLEVEAEESYLRAYELGPSLLPETKRPHFYVGYGSTLRNNRKLDESLKVLEEG